MCDRLTSLDLDVVVQIIGLLDIEDVISLRQTSKHFASVTRLRTVWHNLLVRDVLSRNLPAVCSAEPASLDSAELESSTLNSIRTEKQWQNATSTHAAIVETTRDSSRIHALKFLGSAEGRYLLTLGAFGKSQVLVETWDLDAVPAQSIGSFLENGRMSGYAVDEGQAGIRGDFCSAKVAVALRRFGENEANTSYTLFVLDFRADASSLALGSCLQIQKSLHCSSPVNVQAMRGNLIVLRIRPNTSVSLIGSGLIKVVDWTRSEEISGAFGATDSSSREVSVLLLPRSKQADQPVLAVHFFHDWILVFQEKSIEFYFLPSHVFSALATHADPDARVLAPAAWHAWRWPISTLAVTERKSWAHDCAAQRCGLCNSTGRLLVNPRREQRHGNTEAEFTPGCSGDGDRDDAGVCRVCTCRYRPLSLVARFDSYYPWPVNLLHHFVLDVKPLQVLSPPTRSGYAPEIPYTLPPTLAHTLPSTVELLNPSRLALDAHGMLLWTDNEPCFVSPTVEAKQRVAGQRLALPLSAYVSSSRKLTDLAMRVGEMALEHPENAVLTSPWGHHEAQEDAEEVPSALTRVYASNVSDTWCALDFCASAGRVALGHTMGKLEVIDFFGPRPRSEN